MSPSACDRIDTSPATNSPFTVASTLQHVMDMSLVTFRQTFTHVYRALDSFHETAPEAQRAQLTIGVTLGSDGSLEDVSTPEYRMLIDDQVETIRPDDFDSYDLYLSFWTDDFEARVQTFKQSVVTEVLRILVITDRQAEMLPDEERIEYESMLANRRDV